MAGYSGRKATVSPMTRYQDRLREGWQGASIEFEEDQYERLRDRARREQRPIAAVVRIAVEQYLDRHSSRRR